jgi:hypothetical protein
MTNTYLRQLFTHTVETRRASHNRASSPALVSYSHIRLVSYSHIRARARLGLDVRLGLDAVLLVFILEWL